MLGIANGTGHGFGSYLWAAEEQGLQQLGPFLQPPESARLSLLLSPSSMQHLHAKVQIIIQ